MENKGFKRLSVFVECSTESTPTVETVKNYIRILSQFGYNELYLGLTEGYKIEGEPYFNYMRGGYTIEQLQEMDACAKEYGIELIANIQVLGHLPFLKKYAVYTDMFDTNEVLLVDDERVYALVEKMIATMAAGLSSRKLHIGMDECEHIGQGRYKNLHEEDVDGGELLLRHLNRVNEIAKKYGYTLEIWGDMLSENKKSRLPAEEIKARIPEDIETIYWYYGPISEEDISVKINDFLKTATKVGYAGAGFKYCGFGPNNYLAKHTLFPQMSACKKIGIDHFMITLWSDHGGLCSIYSILPALYVAAEFARGEITDMSQTNKERFKEIVGISYDEMYSLDLLNNPFQRPLDDFNSRSYWLLFDDVLTGNKHLMLTESTAERYAEIEKYYASIDGGDFAPIFRMAQKLAKIFTVTSFIGRDIRAAYKAKDKKVLQDIIDNKLIPLKKDLEEFADIYRAYWDHDNMSFGVDALLTGLGAVNMRYSYTIARLNEYITRDRKVEELEAELLPVGEARATEDTFHETRYSYLLSCCNII